MKLPILFILLCSISLLIAQSRIISYQDLNVEKTEEGTPVHYYNGHPFTGTTHDFYEQENISLEHHLKNGLLTLKEGFRNGVKIEYVEFKEGELDGTFLNFFDNGQKYVEHHYRQGAMHGMQYGWNKDGTLRFVSEYEDGLQQSHINYPPPGGFNSRIKNR
ncbi:MAG: hypothetical protein R2824_24410 [Saprospiraceae bacterium]|nr:hypothetical protein [Lewinella sp.]